MNGLPSTDDTAVSDENFGKRKIERCKTELISVQQVGLPFGDEGDQVFTACGYVGVGVFHPFQLVGCGYKQEAVRILS